MKKRELSSTDCKGINVKRKEHTSTYGKSSVPLEISEQISKREDKIRNDGHRPSYLSYQYRNELQELGRLHASGDTFVNPDTKVQAEVSRYGDNGDCEDIIIPAPVHKYTTTNPCTQSPTYHLIYDLTSHRAITNPASFLYENTDQTANHVFTHAYHSPNPPVTYPSSFSDQGPPGKSSAWDGPMAPVSGSTIHTDGLRHRTDLVNGEPNTAINWDCKEPALIKGDTAGPFTIHFSEPSLAEQRGRPNGVAADKSKIIGDFIDSDISTTSGSNQRHSAAAFLDTPKKCALNTGSADATNISTLLALQSRRLSSSAQRAQAVDTEIPPSTSDSLSYCTGVRSGCTSNRLKSTLSYIDKQSDFTDSHDGASSSHRLSEPNGISLKDSDNNIEKKSNISDKISYFNVIIRNSTNLGRTDDEEVGCNTNKRKSAIFRRRGDPVRLDVAGGQIQSDDSEVDHEQFQKCVDVDELSSQFSSLVSGRNGCLSDSSTRTSTTKGNGDSDNRKNIIRSTFLSRVLNRENNRSEVGGRENGKKLFNRWDGVKVLARQTHASVTCAEEKPVNLTIGNKPSPTSHSDISLFSPPLPLRSSHTPRQGDKRKTNKIQNEALRPVVERILVNKSAGCAGNKLGVRGSKEDCVSFIDNTVTTVSPQDICDSTARSFSSGNLSKKEVLGRIKHIAKHRDVQTNEQCLNLRRDSVFQNGDHAAGLDTARGYRSFDDELGTSEQFISFDDCGQGRHSPVHFGLEGGSCRHLPSLSAASNISTPWSSKFTVHEEGSIVEDYNQRIHAHYKTDNQNALSLLGDFENKVVLSVSGTEPCPGIGELSLYDPSYNSVSSENQGRVTQAQGEPSASSVDLRHNYASESSDFPKTSEKLHRSVEFSGEETLIYRKNLREQCKKHSLRQLRIFSGENNWTNKNFLKQTGNNLEVSTLSHQNTVVGEFPYRGTSSQKTQKITPRQKFEIRHSRVAERVKTFLQLASKQQETQSEDSLQLTQSNKSVSGVSYSFSKDSPRARFERDRAAKTQAITGSSREKLRDYPIELGTNILELSHSRTGCSDQTNSLSWSCSDLLNSRCDKAVSQDKNKRVNNSKEKNHLSYLCQVSKESPLSNESQCFSCTFSQRKNICNLSAITDSLLPVQTNNFNGFDVHSLEWRQQSTSVSEIQCPATVEETIISALSNPEKSNIDTVSASVDQGCVRCWNDKLARNPDVLHSSRTQTANVVCAEGTACSTDFKLQSVLFSQDQKRATDSCVKGDNIANSDLHKGIEPEIQELSGEPVKTFQRHLAVTETAGDCLCNSISQNVDFPDLRNSCKNNVTNNLTSITSKSKDLQLPVDTYQTSFPIDKHKHSSVTPPLHNLSSAETNMLASKGLRIYESGEDFIAMMSPVKSPLFRSASSSDLQWEGTTYLIVPTIVEPVSPPTATNSSEHTPQRSISDSGTPANPGAGFLDSDVSCDINTDTGEEYLVMSSRNRLNLNHRSMSVDVLCAEEADPESEWHNSRVVAHRGLEDSGKDGRGYVEWKTCSSWVRSGDKKSIFPRNSQGYVEWDTIWTTVAPWLSEAKDEEHVYDVIGEDGSVKSSDEDNHGVLGAAEADTPTTADTPPALPERTYISRLKNAGSNNNNNNNNNNKPTNSPSFLQNKSSHHWHSHHHHDASGCKKHHHHHHHHYHNHHSTKQHKELRSPASSSTSATSRTSSTSSPSTSQKHRQNPGSKPKPPHPHVPRRSNTATDSSQNYAEVHKLKGYKFTNLMTVLDNAALSRPDKSAVYLENYWHLAPVTSQNQAMTLQTGDVLDYIDGLHDSLSPKSRENIYLLLNNKQTRAKFSESLEIESRLLSKGLISGSGANKPGHGKTRVKETSRNETTKETTGSGIIRRKGATAPVSSTYV